MLYLDLTLPTIEENLALDEGLLDACEEEGTEAVLRFWEPAQHAVVLGYSRRVVDDVNTERCREKGVPILRRASGGGTVVQGPGCLNYAVVFPLDSLGTDRSIRSINAFVMERHRAALSGFLSRSVEARGTSDLTIGSMKISGNAQRRRQRFALVHGTLLLSLDLGLVEALLPVPDEQPWYRAGRGHSAFMMNLGANAAGIRNCLRKAWGAEGECLQIPLERTRKLLRSRYGSTDWIHRR